MLKKQDYTKDCPVDSRNIQKCVPKTLLSEALFRFITMVLAHCRTFGLVSSGIVPELPDQVRCIASASNTIAHLFTSLFIIRCADDDDTNRLASVVILH